MCGKTGCARAPRAPLCTFLCKQRGMLCNHTVACKRKAKERGSKGPSTARISLIGTVERTGRFGPRWRVRSSPCFCARVEVRFDGVESGVDHPLVVREQTGTQWRSRGVPQSGCIELARPRRELPAAANRSHHREYHHYPGIILTVR